MTRVTGPVTVLTQDGEYHLPPGWDGWIAIDSDGYPYPISAEEQARSYVPVEEPE